MLSKVLQALHQHPIKSIGALFVIGMMLIMGTMVSLSNKMNQDMAVLYAATYVRSLDAFQSMYSSKIVARVKSHGIKIAHNYLEQDGAIPYPATFSIELAAAINDPESGIRTRLYSDYPFSFRKDGGPKDQYESLALTHLRFAQDNDTPFVRFEEVDGRWSLRYAKALVMKQSCVDCHNTHLESPKKNWKLGDVRGVREVIFPLDVANQMAHGGWAATLAVMVALTITGLGIISLVVQGLRASIGMLSRTNVAYSRFVPHEFLEYLNKQNIVDVQLNDNIEKHMTILFSDIRSFTDLSEQMTPEDNFAFINDYLSMMGPVIRSNHGFIDKYIGDTIMALFDDPDDAVRASIEMLDTLNEYNGQRVKNRHAPIRIGIGVHTGKLRLGTIGEQDRMDGTVISDAVNLASRIEGLTKVYGVDCLITGNTHRGLQELKKYPLRLIDKVKVKGKQEPVIIYEMFGGDPSKTKETKAQLQRQFEQAIRFYQVGDLEKARNLFEQYLDQFPDDKPAQVYVERCGRHMGTELGDDWDGTLVLDNK